MQPCASTDAECDQEVFKEYEAWGIGEDGKALVANLEVGDDVCVQAHPSPRYPEGDNFWVLQCVQLACTQLIGLMCQRMHMMYGYD